MSDLSDSESHRLAVRIYLAVAAVLVVAVLLVLAFGLHVLGLIGIVLTVIVFAIMLAFTAGN